MSNRSNRIYGPPSPSVETGHTGNAAEEVIL